MTVISGRVEPAYQVIFRFYLLQNKEAPAVRVCSTQVRLDFDDGWGQLGSSCCFKVLPLTARVWEAAFLKKNMYNWQNVGLQISRSSRINFKNIENLNWVGLFYFQKVPTIIPGPDAVKVNCRPCTLGRHTWWPIHALLITIWDIFSLPTPKQYYDIIISVH